MTYLDHNAGTPLHPEVAEFLAAAFRREGPGNPSSVHGAGRAARARLDAARARVARILGRSPREVLFTASGSEACATAVLGLGRGGTMVTSAIEHPCVLLAATRRGTPVLELTPAEDGRVGEDALEAALAGSGVTLCALQAANNETGVVQPAEALARLARARGVPSFVDAVQVPGRLPAVFEADAVAYSAHKFGGPAGVGLLAVRRGVPLEPLVPGHQEGGLRGGTPSVVLCEAAALALELAEAARATEAPRLTALRDGFERAMLRQAGRPGAWRRRATTREHEQPVLPGGGRRGAAHRPGPGGVRGVGGCSVRLGDDAPLAGPPGDGRLAGGRAELDPHLVRAGDQRGRRDRPRPRTRSAARSALSAGRYPALPKRPRTSAAMASGRPDALVAVRLERGREVGRGLEPGPGIGGERAVHHPLQAGAHLRPALADTGPAPRADCREDLRRARALERALVGQELEEHHRRRPQVDRLGHLAPRRLG